MQAMTKKQAAHVVERHLDALVANGRHLIQGFGGGWSEFYPRAGRQKNSDWKRPPDLVRRALDTLFIDATFDATMMLDKRGHRFLLGIDGIHYEIDDLESGVPRTVTIFRQARPRALLFQALQHGLPAGEAPSTRENALVGARAAFVMLRDHDFGDAVEIGIKHLEVLLGLSANG